MFHQVVKEVESFYLRTRSQLQVKVSKVNFSMSSIHKMVKRTLRILQLLLQDFSSVYDDFVDARCYGG